MELSRKNVMQMEGNHHLNEIASFVRQLPTQITSVKHDENDLIAGDKGGIVSKWCISNGRRSWSRQLDPSVSDIHIVNNLVMVASGKYLYCLTLEEGSTLWSVSFDGACDLLSPNEKTIWVTSSVYEIEIGHYVDCKVQELDIQKGVLIQSVDLPSKAWSIESIGSDCILGLGRPNPGVYFIRNRTGKLEPITDAPDLPIVESTRSVKESISFLTASGTAFEIDSRGRLQNIVDEATCVGYRHDGTWLCQSAEGKNELNVNDDFPTRLVEARFVVCSETMTATMTKSDPTKGIIYTNNLNLKWFHSGEVTSYSGNGDRISIGYSTGEIILLESRVVENRAQAEGVIGEDRSEIRARLRMLRFEE